MESRGVLPPDTNEPSVLAMRFAGQRDGKRSRIYRRRRTRNDPPSLFDSFDTFPGHRPGISIIIPPSSACYSSLSSTTQDPLFVRIAITIPPPIRPPPPILSSQPRSRAEALPRRHPPTIESLPLVVLENLRLIRKYISGSVASQKGKGREGADDGRPRLHLGGGFRG